MPGATVRGRHRPLRGLAGACLFSLLLLLACAPWVFPSEGEVRLPPGFRIGLFAEGLPRPRFMAVSPGGELYVSLPRAGRVAVLPDRDGDGRADRVVVFAEGLNLPHGLAFHGGYLYVAETDKVRKMRDGNGDLRADGPGEVIIRGIPTGGHWTRTIGFGPDGKLYLSVGSSCNVCIERDPRRAAIVRYNADGTGEGVYARGIRNAVGFRWHPETGELWATNNGRDWLGDDFPPDALYRVVRGGHYGWPHCNGDRIPDPDYGDPALCPKTLPPTVALQAHSAPLGLVFYTGRQFPAEHRGDLFVAFHGSWNRRVPTGYKVVRVPFREGKPTGEVVDFAVGWLRGRSAWGRPVDLVVAPDGSLLLSDDFGGRIYRLWYQR
ncbi:MAG: PQQ-dependent sugar dehydrogenase [Nitrospinota bacterium]